jgi:hypothetical protein
MRESLEVLRRDLASVVVYGYTMLGGTIIRSKSGLRLLHRTYFLTSSYRAMWTSMHVVQYYVAPTPCRETHRSSGSSPT